MLDKILHSLYNNMRGSETGLREIEVWLSLVERCVRDAEAVGSSPVTSTNKACISYKDKRMYRFSVWRHSSAG